MMNGVEWITTRMIHGATPIILNAPKLFGRHRIYIEPTGQGETFTLRIIDPLTDHRTEPVEISREVADAAIRTFENEGPASEERQCDAGNNGRE